MQRLIVRSVLVTAFEVFATTRLAQEPYPVRLFSAAMVCKRCNLRSLDLNSWDLSRVFLRSSDLTRALFTQANLKLRRSWMPIWGKLAYLQWVWVSSKNCRSRPIFLSEQNCIPFYFDQCLIQICALAHFPINHFSLIGLPLFGLIDHCLLLSVLCVYLAFTGLFDIYDGNVS